MCIVGYKLLDFRTSQKKYTCAGVHIMYLSVPLELYSDQMRLIFHFRLRKNMTGTKNYVSNNCLLGNKRENK